MPDTSSARVSEARLNSRGENAAMPTSSASGLQIPKGGMGKGKGRDLNQPTRIADFRQRLEQNRVHDPEDRGVGSDSQR